MHENQPTAADMITVQTANQYFRDCIKSVGCACCVGQWSIALAVATS